MACRAAGVAHDREGAARPVALPDRADAGPARPSRRRRGRCGGGGPAACRGRGDEDFWHQGRQAQPVAGVSGFSAHRPESRHAGESRYPEFGLLWLRSLDSGFRRNDGQIEIA